MSFKVLFFNDSKDSKSAPQQSDFILLDDSIEFSVGNKLSSIKHDQIIGSQLVKATKPLRCGLKDEYLIQSQSIVAESDDFAVFVLDVNPVKGTQRLRVITFKSLESEEIARNLNAKLYPKGF